MLQNYKKKAISYNNGRKSVIIPHFGACLDVFTLHFLVVFHIVDYNDGVSNQQGLEMLMQKHIRPFDFNL